MVEYLEYAVVGNSNIDRSYWNDILTSSYLFCSRIHFVIPCITYSLFLSSAVCVWMRVAVYGDDHLRLIYRIINAHTHAWNDAIINIENKWFYLPARLSLRRLSFCVRISCERNFCDSKVANGEAGAVLDLFVQLMRSIPTYASIWMRPWNGVLRSWMMAAL